MSHDEQLHPPYQVPVQGGFISAQRITAGAISVGEFIESDAFSAGSDGWRITGDGNAEFNDVTVRGEFQTGTSGAYIHIRDFGGAHSLDVHNTSGSLAASWNATSNKLLLTLTAGHTYDITGTFEVSGDATIEGSLTCQDTLAHTGLTAGFFSKTPATQAAKINDPAGGATVDAEARTAINAIIDVLERFGLTAT